MLYQHDIHWWIKDIENLLGDIFCHAASSLSAGESAPVVTLTIAVIWYINYLTKISGEMQLDSELADAVLSFTPTDSRRELVHARR